MLQQQPNEESVGANALHQVDKVMGHLKLCGPGALAINLGNGIAWLADGQLMVVDTVNESYDLTDELIGLAQPAIDLLADGESLSLQLAEWLASPNVDHIDPVRLGANPEAEAPGQNNETGEKGAQE